MLKRYGAPNVFKKFHFWQAILNFSIPEACNFIKKETLAQVFSWEFCKISKNTFFYRTPPVAASKLHITETRACSVIIIQGMPLACICCEKY